VQRPRTLADIIKDAGRAVCGHCWAGNPAWACSLSGAGTDGLDGSLRKIATTPPSSRLGFAPAYWECPLAVKAAAKPGAAGPVR
jgi:hypothetical protein